MKKIMQRGFTLIELLVVIAIIGILAAVVLGSLNDARDNANDASAKTSINNVRNIAEVFYSEGGFTYGTTDNAIAAGDPATQNPTIATEPATGATSVCDDGGVIRLLDAAQAQTRGQGNCNADDTAYAIDIVLRSGTAAAPDHYCVDSTGFAGETLNDLGTATVCTP